MPKNITKTFELFKFLTFDKLIETLSNKDKFQAIYTVSPTGQSFAAWENADPFKQFDTLSLFKGYFLDTKLAETLPYVLYTEIDEYYCKESINTEFSIVTYKGSDINIANVFGDKAIQIFKVIDNGNAFESWTLGGIFNEFEELKNDTSYIIISDISKLPYILWNNCLEGSDSGSDNCYECISNEIEESILCDSGSDSGSDGGSDNGSDISGGSDVGSDSGSDISDGSDSESDICYSNIFNLLLDTCPLESCDPCYSPVVLIPVAC